VINVDNTPESIEELLLRLSPSGDLLDLAREMREQGVESLMFAGRDGRIATVVTDRQIAYLAAAPRQSASAPEQHRYGGRSDEDPAPATPERTPTVPAQSQQIASNGVRTRSRPG